MSVHKDGGPAFPQHLAFNPNNEAVTAGMYFAEGPGMSLRDWFAGQALANLVQHKDHIEATCSRPANGSFDEVTARLAYDLADAMLAARKKGGTS